MMQKIYSLIITDGEKTKIWMGEAINLDEAFIVSKEEMAEEFGKENVTGVVSFAHISLPYVEHTVEILTKNSLMKNIVITKDKEKYKEFKTIFSKEEKKLIEESFKKNKKTK